MRFVRVVLILLAAMNMAAAQSSLQNLKRTKLNGTDYVRLKDWSDAVGLETRWLKKDQELQISNRTWKLHFTTDSRRTVINSVTVFLSLPVLVREGQAFISAVDLQTAVHPILSPPKNSGRVKTICLDPGHGGKDTGKIDRQHHEKKYTLLLAEEIARLLRQAGFTVVMTRSRDEYVGLSDRTAFATRHRADLFVSLHYNSAPSSVTGVEVYCMTPAGIASSSQGGGKSDAGSFPGNANDEKNMVLAYHVHRAMVRNLVMADRGVKRARYEVLRTAKMPAVLVEAGFMSNPGEAQKIYNSAFRAKTAAAIVEGILTYQRLVER